MNNISILFASLSTVLVLSACGGPEEDPNATADSELVGNFNPFRLTPLPIFGVCNEPVGSAVRTHGSGDGRFIEEAEAAATRSAYGSYIDAVVDTSDRVVCPGDCPISRIQNERGTLVGPTCTSGHSPNPWYCSAQWAGRARVTCVDRKKVVRPIGHY